MGKLAQPEQKIKKKFVIRGTPAWMFVRQRWISDGARKLYLAMQSLADAKTGELAIPHRGDEERWIKPRTIERRAGMSEETRLKYTKELIELGALKRERERNVKRIIGGRERKGLGVVRYTLLSLLPPTERVSTTPGNAETEQSEPQDSISTTPGNSTDETENALPLPDSSSPVKTGCQILSEKHQAGAPPGDAALEIPEFSTPDFHLGPPGQGTTEEPKDEQSENQILKKWAGEIILAKAAQLGTPVDFPHAYVQKCLPSFMRNLDREMEHISRTR